jgi:hypothetical protein
LLKRTLKIPLIIAGVIWLAWSFYIGIDAFSHLWRDYYSR